MQELETASLKIILELLLLTSSEAIGLAEMRQALSAPVEAARLVQTLEMLAADWRERGLELVQVAGGWRFQTRPAFAVYRQRLLTEKPPRYSRAVMETLAIIAWRQPATRGDIEAVRGVTVSASILRTLEDRDWIRSNGQRQVPGRPALYVTTARFLQDFGLQSLDDLPTMETAGKMTGGVTPWVNRELDLQSPVAGTTETDTAPHPAL